MNTAHDWRVTIWRDDDDYRGGTYSVALEKRLTRDPGAGWLVVSHRTVGSIGAAWEWARDALSHEVRDAD